MTETWYQRQGRMAHAWMDAIYDSWIAEVALGIAIDIPGWYGPGIGRIETIVGYDPQKLLPSPETIRSLTSREWNDAFLRHITQAMIDCNQESAMVERGRIPTLFPGEEITFWPKPRTGRYIPSIDWNKLYGDEISLHRPRERTYEHKVAIIRAGDYAQIELRALAHDPRIRGIWIDIDEVDGHVEGRRPWPLPAAEMPPERRTIVSTGAGKRDMSYLKHDRTKQHRRRR